MSTDPQKPAPNLATPTPNLATLTPEAAHNAVVSVVAMYGGMLADANRVNQVLSAQNRGFAAAIKERIAERDILRDKYDSESLNLKTAVEARTLAVRRLEAEVLNVVRSNVALRGDMVGVIELIKQAAENALKNPF